MPYSRLPSASAGRFGSAGGELGGGEGLPLSRPRPRPRDVPLRRAGLLAELSAEPPSDSASRAARTLAACFARALAASWADRLSMRGCPVARLACCARAAARRASSLAFLFFSHAAVRSAAVWPYRAPRDRMIRSDALLMLGRPVSSASARACSCERSRSVFSSFLAWAAKPRPRTPTGPDCSAAPAAARLRSAMRRDAALIRGA
mmetsp:Transcript_10678/g.41456  ORF Transcript_10678/g.41456 Transcript_10678/m.41456 type:complete len:205 (-) Transcript_10678:292-906(-)